MPRSDTTAPASRREAIVCHYGVAGAQPMTELLPVLKTILRGVPVRREQRAASRPGLPSGPSAP